MSLPAGPQGGATKYVGADPQGSLSPGQWVQAPLTLWAGGQRLQGEASPKWHLLAIAGTSGPKVTSAHLEILCSQWI